MVTVICPICGEKLIREEKRLFCAKGHSFDIARQGYVNLLPVTQKHSRMPGDTDIQVRARKEFLNMGYYTPIVERLSELVSETAHDAVLDVGCGEGYYLTCLQERLKIDEAVGVDISKEAVRYAAVRNKNASFYTATASHLPFETASFDLILSMFSLTMAEEYARLLKNNGHYIRVTAGEDHLTALRELIYPKIIAKETKPSDEIPGFRIEKVSELRFEFELPDHNSVMQLLKMTPHWMRITREGLERAETADGLRDTASVRFCLYTPEH